MVVVVLVVLPCGSVLLFCIEFVSLRFNFVLGTVTLTVLGIGGYFVIAVFIYQDFVIKPKQQHESD